MKVNAWKNIDIECQVDVSLDDCITELLGIADEEGMALRKIQAIDRRNHAGRTGRDAAARGCCVL